MAAEDYSHRILLYMDLLGVEKIADTTTQNIEKDILSLFNQMKDDGDFLEPAQDLLFKAVTVLSDPILNQSFQASQII